MRLENYAELLKYFDELGYPLALMQKLELKEQLSDLRERKFFLEVNGQIKDSKYAACFMLVRPKYENYFAIREYQFTLDHGNHKISQIFPVTYEDLWHPNRLKDLITKDTAYNLASGRSVYFEEMKKWQQIDFKQSDANGNFKMRQYVENDGYSLKDDLRKYPITNLATDLGEQTLLESLRKGNLESVCFLIQGKEVIKFIEANPQFKTINIYDANRKREVQQQLNKETDGNFYKSMEHSKRFQNTEDADNMTEGSKRRNTHRNRM
jgi:hypothetical protein